MSQHDFDISDNTAPAFRADISNAFKAIASNSSGNSEPLVTYPCQIWVDTANGLIKQRNSGNTGWISQGRINQPFWGMTFGDVGGSRVDPNASTTLLTTSLNSTGYSTVLEKYVTIGSGCRGAQVTGYLYCQNASSATALDASVGIPGARLNGFAQVQNTAYSFANRNFICIPHMVFPTAGSIRFWMEAKCTSNTLTVTEGSLIIIAYY